MATKVKSDRLQKIRQEFWPEVDVWTGGEHDKGWFKAPRTLPLILALIQDKKLSESSDPTRVYLELLSRQFGDGVVEIQNEAEHAYAAGYTSSRATRTWQDHMRCLERLGFIKIKGIGKHAFKYVALVHPVSALEERKIWFRRTGGMLSPIAGFRPESCHTKNEPRFTNGQRSS